MTNGRQSPNLGCDVSTWSDALYKALVTNVLVPPPPDEISLDAGHAVQERVFEMAGGRLGGWKLGATSDAAQKAIGLSCPVVGRLAAADIVRADIEVECPPGVLYAEAELAVTLHSELPARAKPYGAEEVASAIGGVHAAIELCTSRFVDDDVPAAALIADNAFAYRLVLGGILARSWDRRFASMVVILDCGGGSTIRGSTMSVMGNPINAVTWLANWLSDRGRALKPGQIIATGSCTGVTPLLVGETVRASFDGADGAAVTIIPYNGPRRSE